VTVALVERCAKQDRTRLLTSSNRSQSPHDLTLFSVTARCILIILSYLRRFCLVMKVVFHNPIERLSLHTTLHNRGTATAMRVCAPRR
jgi:hypothetical protein